MCCCPPIARDRLVGLADVSKSLVNSMEKGSIPPRMPADILDGNINKIVATLNRLLDSDIFPWLQARRAATATDRLRASTIVADRLCGAVSDPLIRNAQEQRQLKYAAAYLRKKGYLKKAPPSGQPINKMERGTFCFRLNVLVGEDRKVTIPIDLVIQPKVPRQTGLPVLIEAKSAGDFTNVNKRRKEEATKMRQLRGTYGEQVEYILFLCGYFDSGYLGYEAAEGIDWVWEHRIVDLELLGI